MNIIAIWERPEAPQGSTFILLDDRRFLAVNNETEFQGTDKEGNGIYQPTGFPAYYPAFFEQDFDFKKADHFIRHFGGQLIWTKETNL